MSIAVNALIGAEQVQRAAFVQLFNDLNGNIDAVELFMNDSDLEIFTMRGEDPDDFVATTLENVEPANFHEGHRPSLIEAPLTNYPNVSVFTGRAVPAPGSDQYDHQQAWTDQLLIEIMVKSESSEEECNRRIKRMSEAVHVTMQSDSTLGGVVHGFNTPSVVWGEVFTRKEKPSYGPHWFWQGARLEYSVRKEATMPSATGVFEGLNIDQA